MSCLIPIVSGRATDSSASQVVPSIRTGWQALLLTGKPPRIFHSQNQRESDAHRAVRARSRIPQVPHTDSGLRLLALDSPRSSDMKSDDACLAGTTHGERTEASRLAGRAPPVPAPWAGPGTVEPPPTRYALFSAENTLFFSARNPRKCRVWWARRPRRLVDHLLGAPKRPAKY